MLNAQQVAALQCHPVHKDISQHGRLDQVQGSWQGWWALSSSSTQGWEEQAEHTFGLSALSMCTVCDAQGNMADSEHG